MPILIDKPVGYTSHDVVAVVRRTLNVKTVGHAGTLDPLASGLLIILVGRAETKQQAQYLAHDKEYLADITLGQTSPTYDAEGPLQTSGEYSHITAAQLETALQQFRGTILQTVPPHSAVKRAGQKLYQLARQGKLTADQLPQRQVTISSIRFEHFAPPQLRLRIHCSKGTYIRSLAHDLGQVLGCGAYLSGLRRTQIGNYNVKDAIQLADIGVYYTHATAPGNL